MRFAKNTKFSVIGLSTYRFLLLDQDYNNISSEYDIVWFLSQAAPIRINS